MVSGGLSSAGGMAGLSGLRGLFQPNGFHDFLSKRGEGAPESRRKPWKDLNFSQLQIKRLREKCTREGGRAGISWGQRLHLVLVCRGGKRLLGVAGLSTPSHEDRTA